jgi:PAS domain S-box-containing protein
MTDEPHGVDEAKTESGKVLHATSRDHARHMLALKVARICTWDWDFANGALDWSENFPALYGREPESFGATFEGYVATCVHPDDHTLLTDKFNQARRDGADFRLEFRAVLPSGETRWFEHVGQVLADAGGTPERLLGATLDITERKASQPALREAEQRFRVLIESATEYAIFTLDAHGLVTSWNPGAERIIGYPEAEILGQPAAIIFTPEDRAQGAHVRELTRAETQGRAANERWHVRNDGTRFWGSGFVEPLRDPSGAMQGFVKIMRDNTERQQAEAERAELLAREQAARAEAEAANRAKDEFLAVVSHELRTPLNAILGWAHILGPRLSDDPTTAKGIVTIERSARQQGRLIEDILDVSRVISGTLRLEPRPIDLTSVLTGAIDALKEQALKKGVQLKTMLGAAVGMVAGDADRLQQVVSNLVSNAIKFTPEGGRVEVELACRDAHAQIIVRDTGIGIEPNFLPHVFDRFRQADASSARRHGGLGLGLAIVRHLAELHGGTVRAESEGQDKGATFTVTLPLLAGAQCESEPGTRAQERSRVPGEQDPTLNGIDVLLVDDERDALELYSLMLTERGARVRVATSTREALVAFTRERPAVLVSDIGMPEKDGYHLIESVRALEEGSEKKTPAIALTAYAGSDITARVLRAGFQVHLAKPVEPAELVMMLVTLTKRGTDGNT